MKGTRKTKPTANKLSVLHQLCNYIPGHLVAKLARKHGVNKKARSFTPWSHVVSMLYAQLTHAVGRLRPSLGKSKGYRLVFPAMGCYCNRP